MVNFEIKNMKDCKVRNDRMGYVEQKIIRCNKWIKVHVTKNSQSKMILRSKTPLHVIRILDRTHLHVTNK